MATKRLTKELNDLRSKSENEADYHIKNIEVDEANILSWNLLLVCSKEPYTTSKGLKVVVDFPSDYPFKPPKLKLLTKVHHPNVDEKGQVCLPLVLPDNWKPAIKVNAVLDELKGLIEQPECDHALRADVAEEYTKDKKKFIKTAKELFEQNGVPIKK